MPQYTIETQKDSFTISNYGTAYALLRRMPKLTEFSVRVHHGDYVMQEFKYSADGVSHSNPYTLHSARKMYHFLLSRNESEYGVDL
jgi:hypothetical protein